MEPIYVTVDTQKNNFGNEIRVTQNDTAIKFVIKIQQNGKDVPFTPGSIFTLTNLRVDNVAVVTPNLGEVTGPNSVTFTLGTRELEVLGIVRASVQILNQNGRISSLSFNYIVVNDLSEFPPSGSDKTLIEKVLGEGPTVIEDAKKSSQRAEDAAISIDQSIVAATEIVNLGTEMFEEMGTLKESTEKVKQETELVKSETLTVKQTAEKTIEDTLATKVATEKVKKDTEVVKEATEQLRAGMQGELTTVKTQLAETMKYEGSMVELLRQQSGIQDKVIARTRDGNIIDVGVFYNKQKATIYSMKKDGDGWWRLFDVIVRPILSEGEGEWSTQINYSAVTGTWNTGSTPHHFTTQVGATFSGEFKGTGFYLNSRKDSRGGIWEFVIDGNIKATVSVWNATSIDHVSSLVAKGLKDGTHTYIATYKGDDPLHTPTSGAGTSRGWANWLPTDVTRVDYKKTITPIISGYSQGNGIAVMQSTSRKEFAFSVKPNGANYGSEWVPEHGVLGVMKDISLKIFFDEREITDLSQEPTSYQEYSSIKFVTNYNAYHPQDSNPLWKGRIDQTINGRGFHTRGRMIFLRDTWVSIGYPGMLAIDKINTDNNMIVTSTGKRYQLPMTTNDNSDVVINEVPSSIAHFTSDSRNQNAKNLVISVELFDPYRTLRIGKEGSHSTPVVVRLRTDGHRKTYMASHQNYVAKVGEDYSFGATYYVGEMYNATEVLP